jgi:amino acid adenylation domain-containing protein/non-ribosomal peptide synthase protein (TIGR01720 family)
LELREHLKTRLPEYLVPALFVELQALPLNANGKVDRAALPTPDPSEQLKDAYVAPRTQVEIDLARIWAELLGTPRVGIHDSFFDLGGDSIVAIQVIARAAREGHRLTPRDVFEHQTIAELAARAGSVPRTVSALPQGLVTGSVPLTPVQRWFFDEVLVERQHFNQSLLLQATSTVRVAVLRQVLRQLSSHHDALRLSFMERDGTWAQTIAGPEALLDLQHVDLSGLAPARHAETVESIAAAVQRSLRLAGPLLRAVFMEFGSGSGGRLLLAAHHLLVDGVSWRILLEDLESAYRQAAAGEPVVLPPKTSSLQHWAERLSSAATSLVTSELAFWSAAPAECAALPANFAAGESGLSARTRSLSVALDGSATRALLQDVPACYRTEINDVLLTALCLAWQRVCGPGALRLSLEGHGREQLFDGVDLTRTVGWFTAVYPVQLHLGTQADLGTALKTVKEQLRRVPGRGLGFGLLRYSSADSEAAAALARLPRPELSFNYLGQFDQALPEGSLFSNAPESAGAAASGRQQRAHRLDVNSLVAGGELQISFSYEQGAERAACAQALASAFVESLQALIRHCKEPRSGGLTPSDVPEARLEQADLDELLVRLAAHVTARDIESLYGLSPLQHGMLYHSLVAPRSGLYVVQLAFDLTGPLDREAFQRAWLRVIERHGLLRTLFVDLDGERPLQLVRRQALLPWHEEDWRHETPERQSQRFDALLDQDRAQGFELTRAPLMRLVLIQLEDGLRRLLWTLHHALADGWSMPILLHELLAHYRAERQGQPLALPKPRPYREYVRFLQRQEASAVERYWRESLAGLATGTPVPFARVPGGEPGGPGLVQYELPVTLSNALRELARRELLTLNLVMQGAWALLLRAYARSQDVVFGVVVSGRPGELEGVESMVGPFINTVPVRVRFQAGERIAALLRRLQRDQAEREAFSYAPLAMVQAVSELPRGAALFESLFIFENYPIGAGPASPEASPSDLLVESVRTVEPTQYPWTLAVLPYERLLLRLSFDTGRFDEASLAQVLRHYGHVLAGLVAAPDALASQLEWLTAEERRQILHVWNPSAALPSRSPSVLALFDEAAARLSSQEAVCRDGQAWTYGELDAQACGVAARLLELGVGHEERVGLFMERGPRLLAALLGIWKAGAAYVPLEPGLPPERLRHICADAGLRFVWTEDACRARWPEGTAARALCFEREELRAPALPLPGSRLDGDSLAYVMYTSGSTGQPKGVLGLHRGIVNRLEWMARRFPFGAQERLCQKTSLGFVDSVQELVGGLVRGVPTEFVSAELAQDPLRLVERLAECGVTRLVLVPSLLRTILEALPDIATRLPRLSLWISSGEALRRSDVSSFTDALPGRTLLNLYGSTEVSADVLFAELQASSSPVLGRPIDHTSAYVLDDDGQPLPVGIAGELYVGGANLARGYHGNPALTAERFIPHPFAQSPGLRLYRTGDLARFAPDGTLEFLGRADQQVKLRGFRIELREVESALAELPSVAAGLVLCDLDAHGDARLVAYVVAATSGVLTGAVLRQSLAARLPEYMLPSVFVFLESLPLLPNGKVDRRRLPAPESHGEPALEFQPPVTPTEQALARAWVELLQVERVGTSDNFFALGGHSLLATRLAARVRRELGQELPLQVIFEARDLHELAQWLEQRRREDELLRLVVAAPAAQASDIDDEALL